MRLHHSVRRIVEELTGESGKISVYLHAETQAAASGFSPFASHPGLDLTYLHVDTGRRPRLQSGRVVNIQFAGEHGIGTAEGHYISCISKRDFGRFTAVCYDHGAKNGGRIAAPVNWSWKGQLAGTMASQGLDKVKANFWTTIAKGLGIPNVRMPDEKRDSALFRAAGLDVEEAPPEDLPEIIKDQPELMPAARVLAASGVNLKLMKGRNEYLPKIPTDIHHQHILQKALDDFEKAGLLLHEIGYDKSGKISKILIMREGVALDQKVAIIESMKIRDPAMQARIEAAKANGLLVKRYNTGLSSGYEAVCEGVTFRTQGFVDGRGLICAMQGGVDLLVGEYEKAGMVKRIKELAAEIKKSSVNEVCKGYNDLITG